MLAEALAARIQQVQGPARRLAAALSKVKLAGIEIDLSRVGQPDGASIPKVLELLKQEASRQIVLMLDEAQHTLTTEAGESAMFALKSARDQLNSPGKQRLLLVFSGSDRAWFAQERDAGAWPPNEDREELLIRLARACPTQ